MRWARGSAGTAESPIAAAERCGGQRAHQLAARLIVQLTPRVDQRAFVCTLVHDLLDAHLADQCPARTQRPMQCETLLAVEHRLPVDTGVCVLQPETRARKH